MIECKNIGSEKIAKHLSKFTERYRLWIHDSAVYSLFSIDSLLELRELCRRVKRVKNIEFKIIKIRAVADYER